MITLCRKNVVLLETVSRLKKPCPDENQLDKEDHSTTWKLRSAWQLKSPMLRSKCCCLTIPLKSGKETNFRICFIYFCSEYKFYFIFHNKKFLGCFKWRECSISSWNLRIESKNCYFLLKVSYNIIIDVQSSESKQWLKIIQKLQRFISTYLGPLVLV